MYDVAKDVGAVPVEMNFWIQITAATIEQTIQSKNWTNKHFRNVKNMILTNLFIA